MKDNGTILEKCKTCIAKEKGSSSTPKKTSVPPPPILYNIQNTDSSYLIPIAPYIKKTINDNVDYSVDTYIPDGTQFDYSSFNTSSSSSDNTKSNKKLKPLK